MSFSKVFKRGCCSIITILYVKKKNKKNKNKNPRLKTLQKKKTFGISS